MSEVKQVISSVSDFKKKREPYPVKLPSGHTVLLKPVSTELVLKHGSIPDYLTTIVEEFFTGKAKEATRIQDLERNIEFMNLVCELSFAEPKVTVNGDNNTLSYDDIEEQDKLFVFSLVNQPSQILEKFRQEQESPMESVSTDESNKQ